MDTVILVCIVVVTASIVVATVYLVITLIQLKKTIKKFEILIDRLDSDMTGIRNILGYISGFGSLISGSWVGVIASLIPKIAGSLFKKKKCKEADNEQ